MNFIFLIIPKPETYEEGKLARLGLVFYWLGCVTAVVCIFMAISDSDGELFWTGIGLFFFFRALLFILADR